MLSLHTARHGTVSSLLWYHSTILIILIANLKPSRTNHIRITSARENIAKHLGSHPDQCEYLVGFPDSRLTVSSLVPRLEDTSVVSDIPQNLWEALGVTRSTATASERVLSLNQL